jgi:hypothetical protein
MAPQNNPSMSAAMDLATDELDALGLDPRTKAMLKTQEAYDLMQSAQRELAMAQQQPMPPTIEGQRTQQTMQGIGALMQQLSPGIQQQGQQMAMAQRRSPMQGQRSPMQGQRPPMQGQRPPMPQQGMAGMPARNMQGMARGGVVGYAGPDGSQVQAPQKPILFDEMGKQITKENSSEMFKELTSYDPTGPIDPTSKRGDKEIRRINKEIERLTRPRQKAKMLDIPRKGNVFNTDAPPELLKRLEDLKESRARIIAARNEGMARGGVIGYAGPDGSQVRPTPTLGAVPPSAVGDEQIKQFASYYQTLQAGLAAATTPEDKAQSQQQIQALIRDMGNAHGKVMQYLDSTKGFTTPSSQMARGGIVGYQDGGRVKRYQGTSEDGSLVTNDSALPPEVMQNMDFLRRVSALQAQLVKPDRKSSALDRDFGQLTAEEREFNAKINAQIDLLKAGRTQPAGANVIPDTGAGIMSGGRGDTFAPAVGVDTSGAGSPQSDIDTTLSSIAALTVPETEIGDLARSPLRDPIENAALKNIKLDASALSNTARKAEQGLASQAYAMSPEMKAAYARKQQESDAEYAAQLDPKKLKDQRFNALLTGLAAPGGIARGGIEALKGVTAVGDTAAELRRKQSEERFGSAKEREGINRDGKIKGYEAGSRMAQSVYERTSATVNQASQSLSQLATSDETRGQAAAVQEYTRQMDGLKLQLNVFLQKEKISQDDRRNLQRIVADMRNAQSDIDNTITKLRSDMLLMEDAEKTAVTALIQTANVQRGLIQQEIDTTLTSLGIDVAAKPSGGGGERAALPAGFVPD